MALVYCAICCFASPARADDPQAAGIELFEKRIRPVLVRQCYECHSTDSKTIRAGLLVDSREGLRGGGDSGPAVVPGKPDESLLLEALRYEGFEMPPSGKLADDVIADFQKWIELGAPDPRDAGQPAPEVTDPLAARDYWSFQPIAMPDVPRPKQEAWGAGDLDRFVLARLEAAGLAPGVEATAPQLARRAYLDLIGLPPTVEELTAFETSFAADAERAWSDLIDRLLASPRYGERWGRHWLDLARYADSTGGGRSLLFGSSWRYRDYVIESFNADVPYDRFIVEQIAGDLLSAEDYRERQRQIVATAFLVLGPTNYEEQNKRQLRMDVVDEQIDTVGRVFLGMTIGCARCHDHKFDPIPTADYYALAGIFRSTHTLVHANVSNWVERELPLEPAAQQAWDDYRHQLAASTEGVEAQRVLVKKRRADLPIVTLDDSDAKLVGSWQTSASVKPYVGDGYRYASGKQASALYELAGRVKPGSYELRVSYTPHANRSKQTNVTVRHAAGTTEITLDQTKPPAVESLYVSLGKFSFTAESDAAVEIAAADEGGTVVVDAVQCLPAAVPDTARTDDAGQEGDAVGGETSKSDEQDFAAELAALADAERDLAAAEKQLKKLKSAAPPAPPKTMAIEDEQETGDYQVCIRGNIDRLGEVAPRGFLSVVEGDSATAAIPPGASGRLELARWIARSEHPLTSRVMVNRVWQHLFGQGIVRSADNLGTTGELPSHPELLDYLATRFSAEGWSVKRLIREIMLSRTYRLSSEPRDEVLTIDPDNRLLAYQNRRRLDAEVIYDSILVLGGKLDLAEHVGSTVREGTKSEYGYSFDVGLRGVYLPVFRNNLPDLFAVFDFPDPNLSIGTRTTSTLATQALFLMNSPFVVEQARGAAESLLAVEGLDDAARLDGWYRRALARAPSEKERRQALEFLRQEAEVEASAERALERWSAVCHAVLASIDFRYVD
ncbi:MAG: DUF1553 domain-containing protein [Pirellulales bacterium]|nr:DUF1553 domain-containing protein [Pirellulales bacterium]